MNKRLPSIERTYRKREIVKQKTRTKKKRAGKKKKRKKEKKRKEKRNHPRDGSLSASNPTRALDTFSGYHKEKKEI